MTLRALISFDHVPLTGNNAITPQNTYSANALQTTYGVPGTVMFGSAQAATAYISATTNWLNIGPIANANYLTGWMISFADLNILQNGATQAWIGFRTYATGNGALAANVIGVSATPAAMTNTAITPTTSVLSEAQLARQTFGVAGAQYVEVLLDTVALTATVYVNGVQVAVTTIPANQQYIVFSGMNLYSTSYTQAFRDIYALDVDGVKPNGRLGPITSTPIAPTLGVSQMANYGAFQYALNGSAGVVTTQSKFGPASLQPNLSTNGAVSIPDQANLKAISSDFTIEGWAYVTAAGATGVLFCKSGSTAPYAQLFLNAGVWQLYTDTTPAVITIASGMQPNVWYHIAVVRYQGTWYLYQNGVLLGSAVGGTFGNNASAMLIGNSGAFTSVWPGFIDEFRVSSMARYTAAFTPPTQAFNPDANTALLMHLDSQVGTTVADYSGNQPNAFQTAYAAAPAMTPLVQNGADNQAISLSFTPAVQAGQKVVAMQYKLAAQVPFAMNLAATLQEGATSKVLSPYQFRDNTAQYGRDLAGVQPLAPDGTAWTGASIGTTSLVLQPQSLTAGATN